MSSNDPNQPGDQPVPGQPYNPSGQPYNPYGGMPAQPPHSENPYGQPGPAQPAPYGQPQQFGYPPAGGYAPVQPPTERPQTLKIAFWLILAAGVVSAISSWLFERTQFLTNIIRSEWSLFESQFRAQIEADPNMANNPEIQRLMDNPDLFIDTIASTITGFVLVSTIVSLVLYFLVGFFVGRGVNAMRIIATILAAFSVVGLLSMIPSVALYANAADTTMLVLTYVLSVVLGVAGVVFAWLRPSSEYINQRKAARRAGYR